MSTWWFILHIGNCYLGGSLAINASLRLVQLFRTKNRGSGISFSNLIEFSPIEWICCDPSLTQSLETSIVRILRICSDWIIILLCAISSQEIWQVVYVHILLHPSYFARSLLRRSLLILLVPFETVATWLSLRVTLLLRCGIYYETVIINVNIWGCINIKDSLRIRISCSSYWQWISIVKKLRMLLRTINILLSFIMCYITPHHLVVNLYKLLFLMHYWYRLCLVRQILINHHRWISWLVRRDISLVFQWSIFERDLGVKWRIMIILRNVMIGLVSWKIWICSLWMRGLLLLGLSHQYIIARWIPVFHMYCLSL